MFYQVGTIKINIAGSTSIEQGEYFFFFFLQKCIKYGFSQNFFFFFTVKP